MNFCPHCGGSLKQKEESNERNVLVEELMKDSELKKLLLEKIL